MGEMAGILCAPDIAAVIIYSAVFLKQDGYWHWVSEPFHGTTGCHCQDACACVCVLTLL